MIESNLILRAIRFTGRLMIGVLAGGAVSAFSAPLVTTNLLLNPGAETGTLLYWTAGGTSSPHVDTGTFDPGINPHTGTNDFLGGTGVSGTLSQVVTLVGNQGVTAAAIDAGDLLAGVSFWEQSYNQSPTDGAYISLTFLGATSNTLSMVATPQLAADTSYTWSNGLALYKLPTGTRYIQYTMNFVRNNGSDLDAFIDDNQLTVLSAAALPEPVLTVAGTNVFAAWTTNLTAGFSLQSNTNLAGTNWVAVTNVVSVVSGTNWVVLPASVGNRFFRLSHP